MSRNRRRHARVRARGVAAHLRTPEGRTACQVENVSMGGLFVRTDRLVEVGTDIVVDLVKPGWKKQLSLGARITSCVDALDGRLSKRMPGMGIQFLRLDDKQHDRLQALLRELGATDDDLAVTLPDEHAEEELRALDLDTPPEVAVLDPQPQPMWQQVELAASEVERSTPPQALVDDIEGVLREANLPPPGPVTLAPERPALKAAPSPAPAARAPAAAPQPEPPRAPPPPPADAGADNARLMLQIRGLVMQLSETQQLLSQRDHEIERLREELATLRAALERSVRNA